MISGFTPVGNIYVFKLYQNYKHESKNIKVWNYIYVKYFTGEVINIAKGSFVIKSLLPYTFILLVIPIS